MGKYSCHHIAAAAARHFSRKLGKLVSESTIKSIKKTYTEQLQKRAHDSEESMDCLPQKRWGRKVLLGSKLDNIVQAYMKGIRDADGFVSSKVVVAGAKGILLSCNQSLLSDYWGPVSLTQSWVSPRLKRMNFVQRKGTTAKSKHLAEQVDRLKADFLEEVKSIVTMEEVPAELVMNWDQTGINLVPSSSWTLERRGS